MKILFFGAKSYDIKSFDAYLDKEEYKDLDVVYIEPNLTPQTAMLAAGYEAVKAVFPQSIVIVHLDNGFDNELYNWNLRRQSIF